jgi:hypothetical protein
MANDLAKQGSRALDAGANPWAEAARGVETGTYLKFNGNDGRWSFGQDDDDLPEGSRVVMDMDTLSFGWICWVDGAVEEEKLVMVVDGKPPREEDLTDYGPYEEDDGWREASSISMILESYGDDDQDEAVGTPLLWKTSTGGQVRQIRKLSGAYGRVFAQHPGEFPIVELGEESYEPRNKRYGKKKFSPIMKIVGWMSAAELEGLTGEPVDEEPEEEPAPKQTRSRRKAADEEAEEKPARGRGRKAKKDSEPEPEEDEDLDNEEPEEEEAEKPARGRRRRAEPEPEPEEDEDEDAAPPARGRTRGRKAAKAEEPEGDDTDGDDEEAAPPRRGRARGGNRRLRNFD